MREERACAFTRTRQGPYAVVGAEGELDIATVPAARVRPAGPLPRVARGPRPPPVTFMDTFALRALIALGREAGASGDWSLHAVPSDAVQRVLDLARARAHLRWISPEQLAG